MNSKFRKVKKIIYLVIALLMAVFIFSYNSVAAAKVQEEDFLIKTENETADNSFNLLTKIIIIGGNAVVVSIMIQSILDNRKKRKSQ